MVSILKQGLKLNGSMPKMHPTAIRARLIDRPPNQESTFDAVNTIQKLTVPPKPSAYASTQIQAVGSTMQDGLIDLRMVSSRFAELPACFCAQVAHGVYAMRNALKELYDDCQRFIGSACEKRECRKQNGRADILCPACNGAASPTNIAQAIVWTDVDHCARSTPARDVLRRWRPPYLHELANF